MTDDNHIDTGILFEAARLNLEMDAEAASHLERCPMCAGRLGWMTMMPRFGSVENAYEPPESALENVLALARDPLGLKRLRDCMTAALTFDSFEQALDVRRGETGMGSRHLTYAARDLEIGLWVRRSDETTLTLAGQVISHSPELEVGESDRVDVVLDGEHVRSSALSPWGEFVFANLTSAEYALQVSLAGLMVRIPAISMLPLNE